MTTNKIALKMDEGNELKFQLKINGETSEPEATKPQVRFLLIEKDAGSSMGLVFPAGKGDDNLVVFSLPPLTGIVKIGTTYLGKVEVILGTRIFCPQTIEINFTKELSVEVVPVKSAPTTESSLNVDEILKEVDSFPQKSTGQTTNAPKKQITLTKGQLESLLEKRMNKPGSAKPVEAKSQSKQSASASTASTKASLKNLMKSALSEDKDD